METLKLNSNDAMRYAIEAMGRDRVDKGGNPYVLHLCDTVIKLGQTAGSIGIRVTDYMRCAAILHDTVEDTDRTIADIAAEGFGHNVCRLVDALTHREGERKLDYWQRVFGSGLEARAIKAADALSNADLSRLNRTPTQRDMVRSMMYAKLADYMTTGSHDLMQLLGYYEASLLLANQQSGEA